MPPYRDQFAANLRRLRKQARYSQEGLAAKAGLHRTELGLLERSQRDPRLATIVRLAHALDVPPAALLENLE